MMEDENQQQKSGRCIKSITTAGSLIQNPLHQDVNGSIKHPTQN
jgi:hypothetical protein